MSAARAALLLALAWLGCASTLAPAFDPRFPDDDRAAAVRVLAALDADPAPAVHDAQFVAATTAPRGLVLVDLASGRARWRIEAEVESQPSLLGDVALTTAGGSVVAFDAADGRLRWRLALDGRHFIGAARADETVLVVANATAADGRTTSLVTGVDAARGTVRWQYVVPAAGRPAATARFFLVPWQRRHVSVIDARDGREVLRRRARDHAVEWIAADALGIRFGDRDVLRLDARYDGALASSTRVVLPLASLPGSPSPYPSAYAAWPAVASAHGRVAVHLAPGDGRAPRFYFVFYRTVLAFDEDGLVRWARLLRDDVVSAAAADDGLVVLDAAGRAQRLDVATGGATVLADAGLPVSSGALVLPLAAPPARVPAAPPPPRDDAALRRALLDVAIDPDSRLLPVREFAVHRLAALADPDVTRDLLDVYAQRNAPPALRRAVADVLPERTLGTEHLVDALRERYDFLEATRNAPLAVIVPALVARGERRALPHLVARMRDHETPLAVLPSVTAAVTELGGSAEASALEDFLRRYRADSSFAEAPEALLSAAEGVLRHGGPAARDRLRALAAAPRTSPSLARGIDALLAPPGTTTETPGVSPVATPAALPAQLDQSAIHATFVDHVDALRACTLQAVARDPTLLRVRLAFVVEHDGSAHAWSFVPNDAAFEDCLLPKLSSIRFPRFRSGRRTASYTIALGGGASAPEPAQADGADSPWWAVARDDAPDEWPNPPGTRPWWRSPDLVFVRLDAPPPPPPASPAAPAPPPEPKTTEAQVPTAPAPPPDAGEEDRWWLPASPAPSTTTPAAP